MILLIILLRTIIIKLFRIPDSAEQKQNEGSNQST